MLNKEKIEFTSKKVLENLPQKLHHPQQLTKINY